MLDDIYRVFVTPRIKLKNLLVAVQWTTDACLGNRLEIEATINLSLATGYWLLATGYWLLATGTAAIHTFTHLLQ